MNPNSVTVEEALLSFLSEDIGYGDITTNSVVDSRLVAKGRIVSKDNAVVAGVEEALAVLRLVGCEGTAKVQDGERVPANTTILQTRGPARALLAVERTLLNLISHMSGVASATADLVSIARKNSDGNVRVACTRKTLPGLRYFEKKAVQLGGGDTHRLRLDDAVLIKDNHLALSGSIYKCVKAVKSSVSFTKKIEIEVTTPERSVEAAMAGADIVLLDNMTPQDVKRSLALLESKGLRRKVLIEASGGITKENLASFAETGVDIVSVGAITHSARAIDVSMEIRRAGSAKRRARA